MTGSLGSWGGAGHRGLTCNSQDAAAGGSTVVLSQGALGAGTEEEAAIRAGDQAGDGSSVTPAHTGMPAALALSYTIPDLPQQGLAEASYRHPSCTPPATHTPPGTHQFPL